MNVRRVLFSRTHGVGSGRVSEMIVNRTKVRNLHLRHGHRKALDNDIVVEGFEHVFRCQGMVNSGIFVVTESF